MKLSEVIQSPEMQDLAAIVAERSRSVVAWIGAGLSVPSTLPTWVELRGAIHTAAVKKAHSYDRSDRERTLKLLTSISGMQDHWLAFEKLFDVLGKETFRTEIRRSLDITQRPRTPHYGMLFSIPWRGILSTNLDELGLEQLRANTRTWNQFTGGEAPRMSHLLTSPRPYFGSLHGTLEQYDSWVIKKSDVQDLVADAGYQAFIRSILMTSSVVFMGASADDRSSGGFLAGLERIGVATSGHFWLTHRADAATDRWAERLGVRVIRYDPSDNHAQFLQLLQHLATHTSQDDRSQEAVETATLPVGLPAPGELISREPNEIRKLLSQHVASIGASGLASFYREYKRCIHQAWLVDTVAPDNDFFDLKLDGEVGKGAFGRVYSATSSDGAPRAVKVLHQDVFDKPDLLNSFRRGVRSLRYLTEESLSGVVKYVSSHEMPMSLVMEYVPGLSLVEAAENGYFRDWQRRILVAVGLADVIRRAHESSKRVLHRDVRPHNVILRDMFSADDNIDIVVLDFDLSWHLDSTERSVYPNIEGALGYGAPEQFEDSPRGKARTTLVDSFGFGMTLLFIALERHPKSREQDHGAWVDTLRSIAHDQQCSEWRSLPNRYARLIRELTTTEQTERLDFQAARSSLHRLATVFSGKDVAASLAGEELMARAVGTQGYEWDDSTEGSRANLSGGHLTVTGDDKDRLVRVSFKWMDPGDRNRSTLKQNLDYIRSFAEKKFRELGWIVTCSFTTGEMTIEAEIETTKLLPLLDQAAQIVQHTRSKYAF